LLIIKINPDQIIKFSSHLNLSGKDKKIICLSIAGTKNVLLAKRAA